MIKYHYILNSFILFIHVHVSFLFIVKLRLQQLTTINTIDF